jgi:hypothetical protein
MATELPNSTYLHTGYAWHTGARLKHVDAALVGKEIDTLGGEQTRADDLIAAGVGGTGELAKCFTQDRDEAAQKRWRDEADYVLRSLVPVVVNTRTEEEATLDQRVWIPVYKETNQVADSGIYRRVAIDLLPSTTEAKPDRQMQGWVSLMAWRDKYGDDPLYAPVIAAIDALKD